MKLVVVLVGMAFLVFGLALALGQTFAVSCNPTFANNPYGTEWKGTVRDSSTLQVISGATIALQVGGFNQASTTTKTDGTYLIPVDSPTHQFGVLGGQDIDVRADKVDYTFKIQRVTMPCWEDIQGLPQPIKFTVDFSLVKPAPPAPGAPTLSAGFTYSISGLTVTFSDSSQGGPTSWTWAFGDGTSQSTQQPTIQKSYTKGGSYTVNMTAFRSSDGASSTASKTLSLSTAAPPSTGVAGPSTAPSTGLGEAKTTTTDAAGGAVGGLRLDTLTIAILGLGAVILIVGVAWRSG